MRLGENNQKPQDPALTDLGLNDSTVAHFKKSTNIDLTKWRDLRPVSELVKTALSDCIVIGSVVKVEHPAFLASIHSSFETIAYVDVKEYLKNDYNLPKGLIPVWVKTGPRSRIIDEDILEVGENVMLFLSTAALMGYAEFNEPILYKKLINDPTVNFRILPADGKYLVNSNRVINTQTKMRRDLSTTKDEIRKVAMPLLLK